ncbi:hypothetical protein BH10BAC2_BH10BAC2_36230 [soil metagenome]
MANGRQFYKNIFYKKSNDGIMDIANANAKAKTLSAKLQWVSQVIDTRMKLYWDMPCMGKYIFQQIHLALKNWHCFMRDLNR